MRLLLCCLALGFLLADGWMGSQVARGQSSGSKTTPAKVPLPPDHARRLEEGARLFHDRIGPLLREQCLNCHGGEKTRSGFDLATREGLLNGGDKGTSVVPFSSKESRLVRLIRHQEEPFMPGKMKKLPDADLALVEKWIDLGAPYDKPLIEKKAGALAKSGTITEQDRQFWSFQPLGHPPVPKTNDPWVRNPIDAFILAKLTEKGLRPNPPAPTSVLGRRMALVLTGLPLTPERTRQLTSDRDALALDRLADELLFGLPHAERWARHWLDIARFAESHGYEQDYDRPHAYPYRDWVIQALQRDLPYDRFVQWQIAGDELAPGDTFAYLATGFLGAGVHATQITQSQVEKERYDELDDIIRTIGAGMLGLTINCARCHDNKYDPIFMTDYYRLIATFTKTVRGNQELPLEDPDFPERLARWQRDLGAVKDRLVAYDKEHGPKQIDRLRANGPGTKPAQMGWEVLMPLKASSQNGATLEVQGDGRIISKGKNPAEDAYTLECETILETIRHIRIEALAQAGLVAGGPGRAGNGNFALSDFRVSALPLKPLPNVRYRPVNLKLTQPRVTFEQKGLPLSAAIDEDKRSGWAVDPQFGKDHAGAFEVDNPPSFPGGTRLTFVLEFRTNTSHTIGTSRLSVSGDTTAPDLTAKAMPGAMRKQLLGEPITPEEKQTLAAWLLQNDPQRRKIVTELADLEKAKPSPKTITAMVCSEGIPAIRLHTQGGDYLEHTHFLKRGDPNQKGDIAKPGFLPILMAPGAREDRWQKPPQDKSRTPGHRANFARWLTDPDQGAGVLLARVIVNRLWHHHFGRGLVATVNDFGQMGDRPTHPELLDWLAGELIRSGWSLRHMHRLIVNSATWRQSSVTDPNRWKIDPTNQYLWRFSPRRLEAESVRDCLLSVSGRLDATPFGPGTLDPNHRRRSIYFFLKRSQLPADLMVFDAPDTLQVAEARPVTTVAPQALRLLNGTLARECARSLAELVDKETPSRGGEWIDALYLRCLGRSPLPREKEEAMAFLKDQTETLAHEGATQPDRAARVDLAHAVLQLNEFVYID